MKTKGFLRAPIVNSSVRDIRDFTWAFHDGEEIGLHMLARIAKQTGLKPEDL